MDFIIGFISSKPQFLRGDEEWMIQYINRMKILYCNSECYRGVNLDSLYTRFFEVSGDQWRYKAIQASRLFYLIDVIDAILHGGSIGHFAVNKKKLKYAASAVLTPLLAEDEEVYGFGRCVSSDLKRRDFRSYISGACYSQYSVAIRDPTLDIYEELDGLKSADLYSAELCNFYKSENFSLNSGLFKNLPISKLHHNSLSVRFSFYPILTAQFNKRDYKQNLLGYRVQVPISCLVAGSYSYQMPEEFCDSNFESYCDKDKAIKSLTHKYQLDMNNLKDLMSVINTGRLG